jgi:hypothetical protein
MAIEATGRYTLSMAIIPQAQRSDDESVEYQMNPFDEKELDY